MNATRVLFALVLVLAMVPSAVTLWALGDMPARRWLKPALWTVALGCALALDLRRMARDGFARDWS